MYNFIQSFLVNYHTFVSLHILQSQSHGHWPQLKSVKYVTHIYRGWSECETESYLVESASMFDVDSNPQGKFRAGWESRFNIWFVGLMKGLKGVGSKNRDHICADLISYMIVYNGEKNEVKSGGRDAWTVIVMEEGVKVDIQTVVLTLSQSNQ